MLWIQPDMWPHAPSISAVDCLISSVVLFQISKYQESLSNQASSFLLDWIILFCPKSCWRWRQTDVVSWLHRCAEICCRHSDFLIYSVASLANLECTENEHYRKIQVTAANVVVLIRTIWDVRMHKLAFDGFWAQLICFQCGHGCLIL